MAARSVSESIERLERMPAFLAAAIAATPARALVERPEPDAFALVEQACHLRDVEREGYLVRVRRILAETAPVLEPFDGAAVARERDYLAQDAHEAARAFAAARAEVAALLAAAPPQALARGAVFGGRRITLRDLVAMMEEHDDGHRVEIERLLARLAVARPA